MTVSTMNAAACCAIGWPVGGGRSTLPKPSLPCTKSGGSSFFMYHGLTAPSATGILFPHISTKRRAFWVARSVSTFPKMVVRPRISRLGERKARTTARASSTPGSVSIMTFVAAGLGAGRKRTANSHTRRLLRDFLATVINLDTGDVPAAYAIPGSDSNTCGLTRLRTGQLGAGSVRLTNNVEPVVGCTDCLPHEAEWVNRCTRYIPTGAQPDPLLGKLPQGQPTVGLPVLPLAVMATSLGAHQGRSRNRLASARTASAWSALRSWSARRR